jgi:hypothetical protein
MGYFPKTNQVIQWQIKHSMQEASQERDRNSFSWKDYIKQASGAFQLLTAAWATFFIPCLFSALEF